MTCSESLICTVTNIRFPKDTVKAAVTLLSRLEGPLLPVLWRWGCRPRRNTVSLLAKGAPPFHGTFYHIWGTSICRCPQDFIISHLYHDKSLPISLSWLSYLCFTIWLVLGNFSSWVISVFFSKNQQGFFPFLRGSILNSLVWHGGLYSRAPTHLPGSTLPLCFFLALLFSIIYHYLGISQNFLLLKFLLLCSLSQRGILATIFSLIFSTYIHFMNMDWAATYLRWHDWYCNWLINWKFLLQ